MSLFPVRKSCGCQRETHCIHGGPDESEEEIIAAVMRASNPIDTIERAAGCLEEAIHERNSLISAMARTLEDCRTRIVGYDFDTAALQARIGELLARAEKCK